MPGLQDVNFGFRHITPVRFGLAQLERRIVLSPEHEQARLNLLQPGLPLRVSLHVGAVIPTASSATVPF